MSALLLDVPTDGEAGAYTKALFQGRNPLLWSITPSVGNPGAVNVEVYADGLSSEGDGSGAGWATVTCWYLPDGTVYGEW